MASPIRPDSDLAAKRLATLADQIKEKFDLAGDKEAARRIGVDLYSISKARAGTRSAIGTGVVMDACIELSLSPLWFYDPDVSDDAVYTDFVSLPPALGGEVATAPSGIRAANPPPQGMGTGTAATRGLREFIDGDDGYGQRPAHVRKTIESMRFVGCEPTAATYEQIAAAIARTTVVRRSRSG